MRSASAFCIGLSTLLLLFQEQQQTAGSQDRRQQGDLPYRLSPFRLSRILSRVYEICRTPKMISTGTAGSRPVSKA